MELLDYNDEGLSTYLGKLVETLPEGVVLEEGMSLGIYSFYKMNMYNDLMLNKEIVINNKNIRTLLGVDELDFSSNGEPESIFPVVNCDSSQLAAIQAAANGKSFCLQGPPGSGKSQTITNIIATLLGNGKKILFVSEKIAALNVVYENLRRVKLSDFALELHSNKANKREFIENLYRSATAPRYEINLKTRFVGAKYDILSKSLRSYEKELHTPIPGLGINLLELYGMYLNVKADEIEVNVNNEDMSFYDMDKVMSLFNEYISYSLLTGYDYRQHALMEYSQLPIEYILYTLPNELDDSLTYLSGIMFLMNNINLSGMFEVKNINQTYKVVALIERLAVLKTYNPLYLNSKTRMRLIDLIQKYQSGSRNLKTTLFEIYDQSIINEDLEKLLKEYKSMDKGSFLFGNKQYKEYTNKILSYRKVKAKPEELVKELEELVQFKRNLLSTSEYGTQLTKLLGSLNNLNVILSDLKALDGMADMDLSVEKFNIITSINLNLTSKYIKTNGERLALMTKKLNGPAYDVFNENISDVIANVNKVNNVRDQAASYMQLKECIEQIRKNGGLDYLHAFLDSKKDISQVSICYKKSFLRQKIDQIHNDSQLLREFESNEEEESVREFRELDERILSVNRDFIIARNSQKRPDDTNVEGSKFSILAKEYNKLRRHLPIRVLLDQIFELALDIKPVFLMSPLSVSTYLNSKANMFDCVIFDEASQIFASDALGSIYRAEQCIIIGDTKQMPPTSFFQAQVDDGENEYDLESILDKATEMFDTSSLKWHYRSRSEELITFSNNSFYDSNLITIPQAKKHEEGFGIDFYFVPEGRYDPNTRTNPIEANKVCDMVFEHFKKSNESLGVVAFSNVQAELINSLIERRLRKNPSFEKYFDENLDEPFFVKNLESVQGDERDRIIFSICYGYNNEGKFYQRFGPLNNVGGERRLNVAVTRAKFNISVVSSVRYEDIKTDTNSKGVQLLRAYLEFAENVVTKKNYFGTEDGIINDIKEYLEGLGYEVLTKYGSSSFKVDLAIKKDNEFVLAIMLDSDNQYSTNLTDKYRLEKLLLERLGWKYFRLYLPAWIDHNEEEKARLYEALTVELEEEEDDEDYEEDSFLKVDNSLDFLESSFPEYVKIDPVASKKLYQEYGYEYLIRELVRNEAPIHIEYLYKRVAEILETKVNNIKEAVDENMPSRMIRIGQFILNYAVMDTKLRINSDRDISEIYVDEAVHGIYTIVQKNNGIAIDGCFRTLAKTMGYNKVMPNVRKLFEEAVENLKLDRKIVQRKDNLFLLNR